VTVFAIMDAFGAALRRPAGLAVALGSLSGCVAAPLVSPMVTSSLNSAMVDVATARFVGNTCPSMQFDSAKAREQLTSIYRRVTGTQPSPAEIDDQKQAIGSGELTPQVDAQLSAAGIDAKTADPQAVCTYGKEQKASGTLIGRLLS